MIVRSLNPKPQIHHPARTFVPVIPVLRKLLPYLLVALAGAAGVYVWKTTTPSTSSATPVVMIPPKHTRAPVGNAASAALEFITDTAQPWQSRVDQLRSTLNSECGELEIRHLYQILENPIPKGEIPEHWYVIANDIMTQLMAHDADPGRFSSRFQGLLQDSRQPLVIRDYAVQYLVSWLNPRSRQATAAERAAPPPEIAAQILQSLVAATTDPELEQTSIPGTTLMMLSEIARDPGGVDCSSAITTLKPWLTHALQDGSTLSNPVRVSAVQAAGMLAPQEFRPLLRDIAFAVKGQSSLRLPSIAALGRCGEEQDLEKLQEIIRVHPELSYAAAAAYAKLSASLQVNN